jgi:hypothetical protein
MIGRRGAGVRRAAVLVEVVEAVGDQATAYDMNAVAKNFRRSMWLAMVTLRLGVIRAMQE